MPQFVDSIVVPAASDLVFRFLRTPANLPLLAQPELHLEIVAAAPLLELGSRVELKGRRWGMTHHTVLEITALEMDKLLVEEQRAGPFREWTHAYRLDVLSATSTRLTDEVTYEPPGGMLGLIVTAAFVQRDLTAFFRFRNQRLLELLGERPGDT
jgi:ligand-binding SRPBCC domain-containing protein